MNKRAMLVLMKEDTDGGTHGCQGAKSTEVLGVIVEVHPDCKGQTYCDHKPTNYDEYGVELDTHFNNKYWANGFEKNSRLRDMQPRIVTDPDNCGYVEEIHQPYTIQVNGTKLVVQSPRLEQRIKITKCLDKQQSCFDKQKAQQDNIDTECDESYTTITLYIYEDGKIQPQEFNIPVSCTCKVHFKNYKK